MDRERPVPSVPVIGWTGSFSTVQHLDTLRGALQELAHRERFRLRVIGTPEYDLEGVEVEAMPWRAQTEIEDLRPIDIGVMPLPDDAWSKGKCGLKALQFMALGIPTICSPVGVNTEIIHDGENGFIAGTEDEWLKKLGALLRSAELRKQLGQAGRKTVETRYSATIQAHIEVEAGIGPENVDYVNLHGTSTGLRSAEIRFARPEKEIARTARPKSAGASAR